MPVPQTQRPICGQRTLVPEALAPTVLNLARGAQGANSRYTEDDLLDTLICTLERHPHRSVHHGVVLNLRGPQAGTIWALWRGDSAPQAAVLLPDCPATNGEDFCSEFQSHWGAHSWDLYD